MLPRRPLRSSPISEAPKSESTAPEIRKFHSIERGSFPN